MEISDAIRDYITEKTAKFPKFFQNIQKTEVILDMEAGKPTAEIVVHASRKHTFVAHHREDDMYACIDQCVDKISQQLRRHKDRVRDHQGTPAKGTTEPEL
jgi:putative sigma-54 modulation protein